MSTSSIVQLAVVNQGPQGVTGPTGPAVVPLYGNTASRPVSPSIGQEYFDTTLGFPVWWKGSVWVGADGTTH